MPVQPLFQPETPTENKSEIQKLKNEIEALKAEKRDMQRVCHDASRIIGWAIGKGLHMDCAGPKWFEVVWEALLNIVDGKKPF